jgi:hypothetical protein
MKIVGKTDNGYLVETTEREMAISCGFDYESEKGWREHTNDARDKYRGREELKIGGTIEIIAAHNYLNKLREKEATVRTTAKIMRELAEMMDAGVPTAVVPPPEQGASGGD